MDFLVGNVVIETNGSYWHVDKREFSSRKMTKKHLYTIDKDKRKIAYLKRKDYRVVVLWEKDIREHFDEICKQTLAVLSGDIKYYNSAKSVKA